MKNDLKPSKSESQRMHQRQMIWQIIIPVAAAFFLILLITVLAVTITGTAPEINEKWAHISAILFIIPLLLVGLLVLVIVILFSWLVVKLNKEVPYFTRIILSFFDQANGITNQISAKSASPLILGKASLAGAKRLLSIALHITKDRKE